MCNATTSQEPGPGWAHDATVRVQPGITASTCLLHEGRASMHLTAFAAYNFQRVSQHTAVTACSTEKKHIRRWCQESAAWLAESCWHRQISRLCQRTWARSTDLCCSHCMFLKSGASLSYQHCDFFYLLTSSSCRIAGTSLAQNAHT